MYRKEEGDNDVLTESERLQASVNFHFWLYNNPVHFPFLPLSAFLVGYTAYQVMPQYPSLRIPSSSCRICYHNLTKIKMGLREMGP